MSTLLQSQALNVSILSENGFGNLRCFEDKLQIFQDGEWITVAKGGSGVSGSMTLDYYYYSEIKSS